MVAVGKKRVLFTAKHSVIEPLFALHLLGTVRDHGHEGTFFPLRKKNGVPDLEGLYRKAEEWGATTVGFNVYDGYHEVAYDAAAEFKRRRIDTLGGGPHGTYHAGRAAQNFDLVFKGQSFDSFGAYLDDKIPEFVERTTREDFASDKLNERIKAYKASNGGREPNREQKQRYLAEADQEVAEMRDTPQFRGAVAKKTESRILFSRFLSPTFPMTDREAFYKDNPDMLDNPIKNSICGEGCPFACRYCYNVAWNSDEMYGRFQRRILRPIDDMIKELSGLRKHNTELIYFQDDVFAFEMKWAREFLPRYAREVGIPFHAQLRLELANDDVGRERLKLMKEAGCTGVTVAIENGDYEIRRDILDRAMKDRHVFMGCRNVKDQGLTLRTEQILGVFAKDTRRGDSVLEYDLKTLRVNCLVHPSISWTAILQLYGGTSIGTMGADRDLYDREKLETNDDIQDSFFDETALNYDPVYKDQVKVLQRLFSTLAHFDRGHEVAETFLRERLPRHNHRSIEDFLGPATQLAKLTKLVLYDNELYKTKDEHASAVYDALEGCRPGTHLQSDEALGRQTKGFPEHNGQDARHNGHVTLETIAKSSLSPDQRAVFNALQPLWQYVPRSEVIADKFLRGLPAYTDEQRKAFIEISYELGEVAKEAIALGPLDREAEIKRLIKEEDIKLQSEREQAKTSCGSHDDHGPSNGNPIPITVGRVAPRVQS